MLCSGCCRAFIASTSCVLPCLLGAPNVSLLKSNLVNYSGRRLFFILWLRVFVCIYVPVYVCACGSVFVASRYWLEWVGSKFYSIDFDIE